MTTQNGAQPITLSDQELLMAYQQEAQKNAMLSLEVTARARRQTQMETEIKDLRRQIQDLMAQMEDGPKKTTRKRTS